MRSTATVAVLLTGLVACGRDPVTFTDAGSVDATSFDGAGEGGATVTVRVRSLDGSGAPDPTATVFFVDPDGTVATQGQPDAAGAATGTMVPGGSVTVAWQGPPATLRTIFAVDDGDTLIFGPDDIARDQAVTIELPVRPGATQYSITGSCMAGSATQPTLVATFSRACGSTRPLLAEARSPGRIDYLSAPAVTPVDGGRITLTGAWAAATTASVDFVGLPATTPGLVIERHLYAGGGHAHVAFVVNPPVIAGATTATFGAPPGFGDTTALRVSYDDPTAAGELILVAYRPSASEAAPIDVTSSIPDVGEVTQTDRTLSWTLSGGGDVDAVVIDTIETARGVAQRAWTVVAPPTVTSVALPVLPAPYDFPVRATRTQLIDVSTYAGYDDAKPRAGVDDWEPRPLPTAVRVVIRSR